MSYFLIVMPNVIMLSVVMLNVVMPNVVMLNVVAFIEGFALYQTSLKMLASKETL